jgi:hypothetical protein
VALEARHLVGVERAEEARRELAGEQPGETAGLEHGVEAHARAAGAVGLDGEDRLDSGAGLPQHAAWYGLRDLGGGYLPPSAERRGEADGGALADAAALDDEVGEGRR